MNDVLSIILKDTYSLSQLKHRQRILKANLLKTFFGGETNTSEEPKPTSEVNTSPADLNWLQSLPQAFYQNFTKDNVYKIFSELDDAALKLNTLILYLSFEPDDATLGQIGLYARKTYNSAVLLLDVKLDPRLIAGTALSWRGVYRDYSLRSQMAAKKQELWEGFKRFLR